MNIIIIAACGGVTLLLIIALVICIVVVRLCMKDVKTNFDSENQPSVKTSTLQKETTDGKWPCSSRLLTTIDT